MVRILQVKLVALPAAMVLAASGCAAVPEEGSGNQPDATAASGAESAQQSAEALQPPASLMENTEEGLEAAVGHWVALLNHAVATGDTAALKEFSAAGCSLCQERIDAIDQAYAEGGSIADGQFSIADISSSLDQFQEEDGDAKVAFASFGMERAAGEVLDSEGKASSRIDAVSCQDVDSNWDEIAYDKDGNFIGSICRLVVQEPAFDETTGWQPLDVAVNAQ